MGKKRVMGAGKRRASMAKKVFVFFAVSSLLVILLSFIAPPVEDKKDSKPDYEMDLTERCKDWLYWRAQIFKRHRDGDEKGANEARRYMNAFMNDLESRFPSEQISDEISRLENEAALRKLPPWSSSIGK
jgi:hypothetical protein